MEAARSAAVRLTLRLDRGLYVCEYHPYRGTVYDRGHVRASYIRTTCVLICLAFRDITTTVLGLGFQVAAGKNMTTAAKLKL